MLARTLAMMALILLCLAITAYAEAADMQRGKKSQNINRFMLMPIPPGINAERFAMFVGDTTAKVMVVLFVLAVLAHFFGRGL